MTATERRARFRALHRREQLFVMPNPWDIGSASSSRSPASRRWRRRAPGSPGRSVAIDQQVTPRRARPTRRRPRRGDALPLNVDSENCFPGEPGGVAETVRRLTRAGAAGCSIEDFDPATGKIMDIVAATAAVREAAEAAHEEDVPIVVTARAENYLYGSRDLDDTIARLLAYRDAGAEVLYAPARHRPRRDHEARRRGRNPRQRPCCARLSPSRSSPRRACAACRRAAVPARRSPTAPRSPPFAT